MNGFEQLEKPASGAPQAQKRLIVVLSVALGIALLLLIVRGPYQVTTAFPGRLPVKVNRITGKAWVLEFEDRATGQSVPVWRPVESPRQVAKWGENDPLSPTLKTGKKTGLAALKEWLAENDPPPKTGKGSISLDEAYGTPPQTGLKALERDLRETGIQVDIPGIGMVVFPNSMTTEEITEAVQHIVKTKRPPKASGGKQKSGATK